MSYRAILSVFSLCVLVAHNRHRSYKGQRHCWDSARYIVDVVYKHITARVFLEGFRC